MGYVSSDGESDGGVGARGKFSWTALSRIWLARSGFRGILVLTGSFITIF